MLQKHKFRRPKYMNIPGSLCDDPRWIKLSPEAAKALVTILLIAGENRDNSLLNPEMLHLRLRAILFWSKRDLTRVTPISSSRSIHSRSCSDRAACWRPSSQTSIHY